MARTRGTTLACESPNFCDSYPGPQYCANSTPGFCDTWPGLQYCAETHDLSDTGGDGNGSHNGDGNGSGHHGNGKGSGGGGAHRRPSPPPPPRDPCAHQHCAIPPGPKGLPYIALPVSLTSVAGAVTVAEDLGLDFGGWVIDEALTDLTDLLVTSDEPEPNGRGGDGGPDYPDSDDDKAYCNPLPLTDGGRTYGGLQEYTDHFGHKGCRATGATAYLTKSDRRSRTGAKGLLTCPECEPSVLPDGMLEIAAGGGKPQAGHLIGYWAKGTGQDVRNLVALNARANARMASKVEYFGWSALNAGKSLYMTVTPVYGDPHSAVPTIVQVGMTAYGPQGPQNFSCMVNSKSGIGSKCSEVLGVAALSEIAALLGEPQFNWSDPAPWIALEEELGIEFPTDFREVVDAYGSIVIKGQLYLNHPASHLLHNLGEEIRGDLELWCEEDMRKFLPGRVGANPGELMPVASASTGETVFLRIPGELSSPWRVVVQEFDSFSWVVHELTFSEWLLAYLRGEDVTVCSRNLAPDRPFFESMP